MAHAERLTANLNGSGAPRDYDSGKSERAKHVAINNKLPHGL
jgi:hypothetical protein